MSYTEKQIKNALMMERFIIQENNHFWVPKTDTLKWLRLNPKIPFKQEDYHSITLNGGEFINAFHCTCVWGTYRDGRVEPNCKYCCHVIAVVFRLIKNKVLPEYWGRFK